MQPLRAALTRVLTIALLGASALSGQVTPPNPDTPSRLANVSVRAFTGPGGDVLIAGFVLSGSNTRPMLLRAVGPGLAPFGVTNYLIDPELRLFRTTTHEVVNHSWGDDVDLVEAHQRLGAFALAETSRDAAVLMPLAPGTYTAHARGRNGTRGDVLLEIYDAATATDEGPAMVNVSLRGELGPSASLLIGGFVVTEGAPKRVLVRAIGPTLAQFGLANALGDPRVRLYRNGQLLMENDDWTNGNDPAATETVFQNAGAFALARTSRDAVLVATLPPGSYTAHVDDVAGGPGVVLAEIYDLEPPPPGSPPAPAPAPGGALPTVSILALKDSVVEGAAPGASILLIRAGDLAQPLRVHLSTSGTAGPDDYTGVPSSIVIPAGSATKAFTVGAWVDPIWEPSEVLAIALAADPAYAIGGAGRAHIVIRDASPLNGPGWQAEYFNNRTLTGAPVLVRTDREIRFNWGNGSPDPAVTVDNFSVRWTGSIQVDTTQDYTFVTNTDDGTRLWVDGVQLVDRWVDQSSSTDYSGTIRLAAGVRYAVRMEYYERSGNAAATLSWQAAGMPKTPVPTNRIFPPGTSAPAITSPTTAIALVGGPFAYATTASAGPLSFSATGLPAGLAFDAATGAISGTPTAAGTFPIVLTATNANGTGAEILTLRVIPAGLAPVAERWTTAGPGLTVPAGAPTSTAPVSALELAAPAPTGIERIRGMVTAPATGVFTFWLAASGPAEFRLADGDQPGDATLRARVTSATAPRQWTLEPGQASMRVALTAGERYFFEIVHRPAAGAHLALGWSTPGQPVTAPAGIVPAYVLSRFDPLPEVAAGKVLYLATMRPPAGVASPASGTLSLLFEEATRTATLALRFAGLSSGQVAAYLYAGELGATGPLIQALPNGQFTGFEWRIRDAGGLTAADLESALRDGLLYAVVHTTAFPGGELRGQFGASTGSAEFRPPAAPPALPGGAPTDAEAARFLGQATFGATTASIAQVRQSGYGPWIDAQLALPASLHLPYVDAEDARLRALEPARSVSQNQRQLIWWNRAITAPDQLRQRVAFALSEILVVSDVGPLSGDPIGLSVYYDLLVRNAFANFRTLLEDVTLSPAMGNYLSMVRNRKPDPARGIYPDENYAREIMQLFSIGLNKLHPDGTLVLDTNGLPIPTYSQEAIVGLAHVFTGWAYHSTATNPNYLYGPRDMRNPMMAYESFHDTGDKRLLESNVLPGGGTAVAELKVVLDLLFNHPNVGPFIGRHLIQRLVTSNPSPGYVHRVARVFEDNGAGVRGDLGAVVRAVLLDYEARSPAAAAAQGHGKLREPLLRLSALWRALDGKSPSGIYNYTNAQSALGQAALRAPTVFNFFEPDFVHPGVLASAGLVAPEFMITSETTVINLSNQLRNAVFSYIGPGDDRITLDLAPFLPLVGDPAALVDSLNNLLMGGTMSAGMRTTIVTAVGRIPVTAANERVQTALNLITVAPEYAVQK